MGENFIKKYLKELPKEFQENMNYYSQAFLYFYKANYENALTNISKVKSETYVFKFDVWIVKLQCLFELGYFEETMYCYDSYKHSLKADTTSPKLMTNRFSNFLHYFNYLLKTETFHSTQDRDTFVPIENLIKEITDSSEILGKGWLIRKFTEISIKDL